MITNKLVIALVFGVLAFTCNANAGRTLSLTQLEAVRGGSKCAKCSDASCDTNAPTAAQCQNSTNDSGGCGLGASTHCSADTKDLKTCQFSLFNSCEDKGGSVACGNKTNYTCKYNERSKQCELTSTATGEACNLSCH